jgi:hypothetical protein
MIGKKTGGYGIKNMKIYQHVLILMGYVAKNVELKVKNSKFLIFKKI